MINKRFDKYNSKLTAFAILCFAKKHADKNGIFYMSLVGLSNWINVSQSDLSSRRIKELCDFGYIEKVSPNDIKFIKRRNKHVSQMIVYKMKVDFENVGEFVFSDSNIREEFEKIIIAINE